MSLKWFRWPLCRMPVPSSSRILLKTFNLFSSSSSLLRHYIAHRDRGSWTKDATSKPQLRRKLYVYIYKDFNAYTTFFAKKQGILQRNDMRLLTNFIHWICRHTQHILIVSCQTRRRKKSCYDYEDYELVELVVEALVISAKIVFEFICLHGINLIINLFDSIF